MLLSLAANSAGAPDGRKPGYLTPAPEARRPSASVFKSLRPRGGNPCEELKLSPRFPRCLGLAGNTGPAPVTPRGGSPVCLEKAVKPSHRKTREGYQRRRRTKLLASSSVGTASNFSSSGPSDSAAVVLATTMPVFQEMPIRSCLKTSSPEPGLNRR